MASASASLDGQVDAAAGGVVVECLDVGVGDLVVPERAPAGVIAAAGAAAGLAPPPLGRGVRLGLRRGHRGVEAEPAAVDRL